MTNIELGRLGEDIAYQYLISERYEPVARNFRAGHSEIDIIVRDAFSLRFVEVKSRMEHSQSTIIDSLSQDKMRSLRRGIYSFLSSHHDLNRLEIYIDLITVVFDGEGRHRVTHTEDFFRF